MGELGAAAAKCADSQLEQAQLAHFAPGHRVAPVDSTPSETSVTAAESEGKWWDDLQWRYLQRVADMANHWQRRSRDPALTESQRLYAGRRARALRTDLQERVGECGQRTALLACKCRKVVVAVGCGQRMLCATCRKRHSYRLRRRLHRSAKVHSRAKGKKWRWALVTLTVRHSGDVAADRERIVQAWRKTRQWLHKGIGAFPFAMTWEVTPGRDGLGHVHAHAIALWPYFDWAALAAQWKRAIGDSAATIDIRSADKGAGGAAEYVAKYVSKGFNPGEYRPILAADVCAAFYGKRLVTTSLRWWYRPPRECRCCGQLYTMEKRPGSMIGALPWATWRAMQRNAAADARAGGRVPDELASMRRGWVRQTEFRQL